MVQVLWWLHLKSLLLHRSPHRSLSLARNNATMAAVSIKEFDVDVCIIGSGDVSASTPL